MKSFNTDTEKQYKQMREQFLRSTLETRPASDLVDQFAKFASRQQITRFLFRHELFKMVSSVKGSIVECGVHNGSGLMGWAQLATILEPMGFFRKIYGFDTFDGFPAVHENDCKGKGIAEVGGLRDRSYEELLRCIELYDQNRLMNHFTKVELVKGDFLVEGEKFLKENPHTLVALLYLDFDLYEPTKKALELFLPRMPKGAVVGFDQVNNPYWPAETLAMLEGLNLRELRLQSFAFEPNMAYAVI